MESSKKGWNVFKRGRVQHQTNNEDMFPGWGDENLTTLLKPCLDMLLNGFEFFVGTNPGPVSFVSQLSSMLRDVQSYLLEEPEEYDSLDLQNRTPWTGDQVLASWEGFMESLLEQCRQRFTEEKALLSDSGLIWVAPSVPFHTNPLPHRDEVLRYVSRSVWSQYKAHLLGLQANAITEVHKVVDFDNGASPDLILDIQWCHSNDPAIVQSMFGPDYQVIGGAILAVDGRSLYLCALTTSNPRRTPEVITGFCFIHSSGIAAPEVPVGFEPLLRASDKLSACLALQAPKASEPEAQKNRFRSRSPTSLRSLLAKEAKKEENPKPTPAPEQNKQERIRQDSDAYLDFYHGDMRGLTQRLVRRPEPEVGLYLCVARGDGPPMKLVGLAGGIAGTTVDQKEPLTPTKAPKEGPVVANTTCSRMVSEIAAGEHAISSSIEGCVSDLILQSRATACITFKPDINCAIYLFSQYILRKNVAVAQRETEIQSTEMKIDSQANLTLLNQLIVRDRALAMISKTLLCLTAAMYSFCPDIVKHALACFKHLPAALLAVTDSDPWFELDGRGWPRSTGRAVCVDLFVESLTRACFAFCTYIPDAASSELSHYMLEVLGFIVEQYTPCLSLHSVGCLIESYFLYVRTDITHQLSNSMIEHFYRDDGESDAKFDDLGLLELSRTRSTTMAFQQVKLVKDETFYYSRIRRWAGRCRWGSSCTPKLRTAIIQYIENLGINDDSIRRLTYLVIYFCCVIESAPAAAREDFPGADEEKAAPAPDAAILENVKVKLHAMSLLKTLFGHQLRKTQGPGTKHVDLTVIRRFVIPLCAALASYPDTAVWEKCLELISVIWADFYYRSRLLDEMGILLESWRVLLESPHFPSQQKLVLLNRLVGDIYFSSEVSAEVLWNYDYYLTLPESLSQMSLRSDFTSLFDAGSVYVNLINTAISVCAAQSVVETDGGAEHSLGANLRHNTLFFVTNCFLLCAKLLYIDDRLPTAEASERDIKDQRKLNGLFGKKAAKTDISTNKSNIDIQVANSHSMLKEVRALLEKANGLVKAEAPLHTIGVFLKGACDQVFLSYGMKQKEAKFGRIFSEFLFVNAASLPSTTVFELLSATSSSDPFIQWETKQDDWLSRAELDFIRQEFLCFFDFAGMEIDLALRYFFFRSTLMLPSAFFQPDPRDLLLSCFCQRFCNQNPEWPRFMFTQEELDAMVITSDPPNAHTVALNLTCSLLEISVRRSDATGVQEFMDGCQDLGLPLNYLRDLYRRTKMSPIIMPASADPEIRPSKHLCTIVDRSNNGLMRSFLESFRDERREPAKSDMNEVEKRELAQVMFTQTWQGAYTIVKNIGESTIDQTALQLTIYGATHALTVARGLRFNQQEEMFADLLIILRRRTNLLEMRDAARTGVISPSVNLVRSHSIANTSYKNCVMGRELVDFIIARPKTRKTAPTIDRARAVQLCQSMMEYKVGLTSITGGTKFEDNNNLYFFDSVNHKPDSLTKDPGMTTDSSSSSAPSTHNSATQNIAALVPQHCQSSAELIDGLNHPLLGIKVLRAKGMRGVFTETYCSIRFVDAKGYFLDGLTRKTCISRDRQNPSWLWEPELMILINPSLYNPVYMQVAVYGSRMGKHRLQGCVNVPMESLGKNWVTQWRVLHKADGTASGGGSIQIRMRLRPPDDRFGSIPPMNIFDTALMLALRPAVVSGCEDVPEEKKPRDIIQQRLMERRKTIVRRAQEEQASEEDVHEQWETSRTGRFLFTDHCPATFRKIRSMFRGGEDEDYITSMCKGPICSVGESKGKSGAGFYKTWDGRFFLKTLRPSESLLLLGEKRPGAETKATKESEEVEDSFLNSFLVFFKRNPDSFIQRFYGCFTLAFLGENSENTPGSSNQAHTIQRSFIVINNVFDTPLEIHATFDLKGSTQGRYVSDKERAAHEDKALIQKDLDFKRSQADCALPKPQRDAMLAQLQRDCQFLEGFDIMDYSLLLGLHRIKEGVVPPLGPGLLVRPGVPIRTIAGHYLYAGIIDVLQTYNIAKKLETTVKSIPFSKQAISCVAPELYAARFYEFMKASLSEPPEGAIPRRNSVSVSVEAGGQDLTATATLTSPIATLTSPVAATAITTTTIATADAITTTVAATTTSVAANTVTASTASTVVTSTGTTAAVITVTTATTITVTTATTVTVMTAATTTTATTGTTVAVAPASAITVATAASSTTTTTAVATTAKAPVAPATAVAATLPPSNSVSSAVSATPSTTVSTSATAAAAAVMANSSISPASTPAGSRSGSVGASARTSTSTVRPAPPIVPSQPTSVPSTTPAPSIPRVVVPTAQPGASSSTTTTTSASKVDATNKLVTITTGLAPSAPVSSESETLTIRTSTSLPSINSESSSVPKSSSSSLQVQTATSGAEAVPPLTPTDKKRPPPPPKETWPEEY